MKLVTLVVVLSVLCFGSAEREVRDRGFRTARKAVSSYGPALDDETAVDRTGSSGGASFSITGSSDAKSKADKKIKSKAEELLEKYGFNSKFSQEDEFGIGFHGKGEDFPSGEVIKKTVTTVIESSKGLIEDTDAAFKKSKADAKDSIKLKGSSSTSDISFSTRTAGNEAARRNKGGIGCGTGFGIDDSSYELRSSKTSKSSNSRGTGGASLGFGSTFGGADSKRESSSSYKASQSSSSSGSADDDLGFKLSFGNSATGKGKDKGGAVITTTITETETRKSGSGGHGDSGKLGFGGSFGLGSAGKVSESSSSSYKASSSSSSSGGSSSGYGDLGLRSAAISSKKPVSEETGFSAKFGITGADTESAKSSEEAGGSTLLTGNLGGGTFSLGGSAGGGLFGLSSNIKSVAPATTRHRIRGFRTSAQRRAAIAAASIETDDGPPPQRYAL